MSVRSAVCAGVALAVCGVAAPAAGAAFDEPVELASGTAFLAGVASATDDGGATIAAVRSGDRGLRLAQRPSSAAPWAPLTAMPGRDLGRAVEPALSAAGRGAAAIAWRIDTPKKYSAIGAVVRDAWDAAFGTPVVVSPADADGVRHPALAVDGEGRGVLAYNTGTRASHLSMRGRIAVSLRDAHGSFGAPVVVDERMSGAPAVAIGPDGRGVVAWLRDRRVRAVSVDVEAGVIGRVTPITRPGSYDSVVVAAGKGGAATVAFRMRKSAGDPRSPWAIGAVRRVAGRRFPGAIQTVDVVSAKGFVRDVAIAADEDGWTILAWSPERFRSPGGAGINGVTAGVRAAVAGEGATAFGRARDVAPRGDTLCQTPAVDAAGGRAVLAWTCRDRVDYGVYASFVTSARVRAPETVMTSRSFPPAFPQSSDVTAGLDRAGTATIIAVRPDPQTTPRPTTPPIQRVLAATGR